MPDPEASFGGHGQLLFGEQIIYLSHLPMFMFDAERHPHNFQVILEVTLSAAGGDPQAAYVADRQRTGTQIYTLAPEAFSLTDLVSTDPDRPPLRSFTGTIFRGHFERGGRPILRDVRVEVQRVVYFRQFEPDAEPLPALEYLLFGGEEEPFLAHVITRPPDFDQILSATLNGHLLDDKELREGFVVTFPGRKNTIPERIEEGERLSGEVQFDRENGATTCHVEVAAQTEFYFEAGELAMAM
jgi:hypothetical protein